MERCRRPVRGLVGKCLGAALLFGFAGLTGCGHRDVAAPRVLRFTFPPPKVYERYWVTMSRAAASRDDRDWVNLGSGLTSVSVRSGADVRVILGSDYSDVAPLADLPPEAVQSIALFRGCGGGTRFGDRALRQVSLLSGLTDLNIANSEVTADGIFAVRHLRSLRRLSFGSADFRDDAVLEDVAHLPALEELELFYMPLDGRVGCLSSCSGLKSLSLNLQVLSRDAWRAVSMLPGLESLTLNKTNVTGDGRELLARHLLTADRAMPESLDFSVLARMPRLRSLGLPWCRLSGEELRVVTGMARLESLNIEGEVLDNVKLTSLSALTSLRRLSLSVNARSDLSFLRSFRHLERLDVSGDLPTSGGWTVLADLDGLRDLTVVGLRNDHAPVWDAIGRLKGLRRLTLRTERFGKGGYSLTRLRTLAGMGRVECLAIEGVACEREDECLAVEALGGMASLRRLDVRNKKQESRMRGALLCKKPDLVFTDMDPWETYSINL